MIKGRGRNGSKGLKSRILIFFVVTQMFGAPRSGAMSDRLSGLRGIGQGSRGGRPGRPVS